MPDGKFLKIRKTWNFPSTISSFPAVNDIRRHLFLSGYRRLVLTAHVFSLLRVLSSPTSISYLNWWAREREPKGEIMGCGTRKEEM